MEKTISRLAKRDEQCFCAAKLFSRPCLKPYDEDLARSALGGAVRIADDRGRRGDGNLGRDLPADGEQRHAWTYSCAAAGGANRPSEDRGAGPRTAGVISLARRMMSTRFCV